MSIASYKKFVYSTYKIFEPDLPFLLISWACTQKKEFPPPEATPSDMVWVLGGKFMMGGGNPIAKDNELPVHKVTVDGFWMDEHEVINRQFAEFVQAIGYITVAERTPKLEKIKKQLPPGTPKPHNSVFVAGSLIFIQPENYNGVVNTGIIRKWVSGANWKAPAGPGSSLIGMEDHPVVHVAWEEAKAYADWAGKRLPAKAEWEYAARAGLNSGQLSWKESMRQTAIEEANSWQGAFRYSNSETDGYYYSAPVKTFQGNNYVLYDMAGNVWEWTSDWYSPTYYQTSDGAINPTGPVESYDPMEPFVPKKIVRDTSFLCNESYCVGFMFSAQMKTSPNTCLLHTGFRCVKDYNSDGQT